MVSCALAVAIVGVDAGTGAAFVLSILVVLEFIMSFRCMKYGGVYKKRTPFTGPTLARQNQYFEIGAKES